MHLLSSHTAQLRCNFAVHALMLFGAPTLRGYWCDCYMYVCMHDYIAVSTRTLTPPTINSSTKGIVLCTLRVRLSRCHLPGANTVLCCCCAVLLLCSALLWCCLMQCTCLTVLHSGRDGVPVFYLHQGVFAHLAVISL